MLIADEPTTALDVMVQAQVLQLLADLQRDRGLAMIFITHDLSVLSTVADRLAVMYAGRLVETGPAKEMLRGAKHPYTKSLAAAFPTIGDLSSRLAPSGLAGDPPDPAAVPSGCPFHPRCPIAIRGMCDSRRRAPRDRTGMGGGVHQAVSTPLLDGLRCKGDLPGAPIAVACRCTPSTVSTSTVACRRGCRARRREWLRQDHAGPRHAGAAAAHRWFDQLRRRSVADIASRAFAAYRRKAQLIFQDPTGSINPRQSIYEIVAEGSANPSRTHG